MMWLREAVARSGSIREQIRGGGGGRAKRWSIYIWKRGMAADRDTSHTHTHIADTRLLASTIMFHKSTLWGAYTYHTFRRH